MGLAGRLTPDKFGWDMPVNAPLYSRLPHHFPNAEVLQVRWETDPEAVAEVLPPELEVAEPATAVFTMFRFPFGTLGNYMEAVVDVECRYQGKPKFYTAFIFVNPGADAGFGAGREIWGVPKKMGHLGLEAEFDIYMATVERPKGNRLITALVRPEQPMDVSGFAGVSRCCLRVIPSVEEGQPPSICELVDRDGHTITAREAWTGPGSLTFNSPSELDPVSKIKPLRIISANYGRYDYVLRHGHVLKRY